MAKPILMTVDYNSVGIDKLGKLTDKYLSNYPTVYFVYDNKNDEYVVYVGETNNISRRTKQHLIESREDWQKLNDSSSSQMIILGNQYFNKSMTLDLENQFMNYFLGVDSIKSNGGINNRRSNPQGDYFPKEKTKAIFAKSWYALNKLVPNLFPDLTEVMNSALFKSSPFKELTKSQSEAKNHILMKIEESLNRDQNQLLIIEGVAGTGKTVLLSNLFYSLQEESKSENAILRNRHSFVLINHNEQVSVYQSISKKIGLNPKYIMKPNSFLNQYHGKKVDIVIVDEGHLLATRNGQAFKKAYGNNHLEALRKIAKVVVLVYDIHQILIAEQYVEPRKFLELRHETNLSGNLIELTDQMRMSANDETIKWLESFIHKHVIRPIPVDEKYDLRIFNDPKDLYNAIKIKSANTDLGLSRMLATYDWPWKLAGKKYCVKVGEFVIPWNYYYTKSNDSIPWAENPKSINEIGSTFTIQGFDLNYAGVIIGPSVKYRKGKLIFDPSESQNKKAIQMSNGAESVFQNLNNELNVLLTRGVHGLFIYAVDDELQSALLRAQG